MTLYDTATAQGKIPHRTPYTKLLYRSKPPTEEREREKKREREREREREKVQVYKLC